MLVTKNPCSHPGDIRKITARNSADFSKEFFLIGKRRYRNEESFNTWEWLQFPQFIRKTEPISS